MALIWYAVQTNPQCERRALSGLKEQGFTTFLPVETNWKRSRSKARERVDKPLFTGYLFVGLAPGQALYDVRRTDGVKGLVLTSGGIPAEIGWHTIKGERVHFIYDLQARQAAGEFDHTPARRSQFRKGDKARVTLDGPFKDLVAEVLSATDDGRVRLLMCAKFGWEAAFDADQLENPEAEVLKAA